MKCTKCSKVMKYDIHSSGTTHLLLDYNSLERACFSPNKHGLCRGRGARGMARTHPTCGCRRSADLYRYYSCGRGPSADPKLRTRIICGREICGSAHLCHRRYVPYVDFSYRGRFVPWIFRTIRGSFVPFVPRTIRTILGLFVPSVNCDVSMKLDDADDKPSTPRMDGCD